MYMGKVIKESISIETLKRELQPFIRQEIKGVIFDLLKHGEIYLPENTIRKSFTKRIEEIEENISPEIYTKQDILEL